MMMHRTNPWQAYRQVATQTATPGLLVLQLYEGILRFVEQARLGFSMDDPKEFNQTINNNIQRAQAIVHELDNALDMTAGGDFAVTLRRLYDYFDRLLQESNLNKTEAGLNEVTRHVIVLRDAWKEMLANGGASQPASGPLIAPTTAPSALRP
jgi:flagellar secretion chaperone FliS